MFTRKLQTRLVFGRWCVCDISERERINIIWEMCRGAKCHRSTRPYWISSQEIALCFICLENHSVKSRQIEFLNENGRKSKKKTNKTLCLLSAKSYQPFGCDLMDRMVVKLLYMVNTEWVKVYDINLWHRSMCRVYFCRSACSSIPAATHHICIDKIHVPTNTFGIFFPSVSLTLIFCCCQMAAIMPQRVTKSTL